MLILHTPPVSEALYTDCTVTVNGRRLTHEEANLQIHEFAEEIWYE